MESAIKGDTASRPIAQSSDWTVTMDEKLSYEELKKELRKAESERKKAEDALRESEEKYSILFERSLNPIAIIDKGGRYIDANSAFLNFTQRNREQLLQLGVFDFSPPEQRGNQKRVHPHIWKTGGTLETAYIVDGRVKILELIVTPMMFKGVESAIGIGKDLTAQRRAEQELQRSETLFSKAFDGAPFLMSISTIEGGEFLQVNEAFCQVTGYAREEVIGSTSVDLVFLSKEDREILKKKIDREGRVKGIEIELRKKSGGLFSCLYFAEVISVKEGKRLLSIAEDITEKRRVEADRTRLMAGIEQLDEIVLITDKQGNIQYVNPAFETVTGYTRDEAMGKTPSILKSGAQDKAFYQDLWETITSGKTWKNRIVNRRKDGSRYTEEISVAPVVNARGVITNFVAVKRDITEEIETEKRLIQAQKMESIGTLAAGIAHDFNNILSPIIMDSEMAMMDLPEDSPVQMNIKRIYDAGERARDLVRQILSFARIKEKARILLKASLVVKEGVKFLRATIPSTINIHTDLRSEQDEILADPTQAYQILMNLCINAAHAMEEEGGTLDIVLDNVEMGPESGDRFADLKPGGYLKLSVADTGKGIAPEVLKKIFDPYFTTKAAGKGTGMGLPLVHNIVRSYGGTIAVDSEPGRGSRFDVYLPLAENQDRHPGSGDEETPITGGNERILLVDDEESILDALVPVLRRYGYHVTAHTRSIDALREFQNNPTAYDLVITDMTMPQMTGKELAQNLMEIRSGIPIILCTGFSEKIDENRALELGIKAYLMKPVLSRQMLRKVREVLGGVET